MEAQQCVLCVVELRITVRNAKVFGVVQESFYGGFMSPATLKRTLLCM
jgi:hypothetical protein